MKYKVAISWDSSRSKSYYINHCILTKDNINDDIHFIVCDSIPPYMDINANKACYIDSRRCKWVFDEEKYLEIIGIYDKDKPLKDIQRDIINTMDRLDDTLISLNEGVKVLNEAIAIYKSKNK